MGTHTHTLQYWLLFCKTLPKVLAVPHLWMWPRPPRLWPMWPGHLAVEHALTSPPYCPHVDMPNATLWTPTAWWDASPVAPTIVSTWKPSVARDTSQSANIVDSHPVSKNIYVYIWNVLYTQWKHKVNHPVNNLIKQVSWSVIEKFFYPRQPCTCVFMGTFLLLLLLLVLKILSLSCRSLLSNRHQALSRGQQLYQGVLAIFEPSDQQLRSRPVQYRSQLHLYCSWW